MISLIAGVVVLYNPDDIILSNINSYINDIDTLFAVDNSEIVNQSFIEQLAKNSKIQYISNGGNQGIAHALNVGANKAVELGYEWLLTMDQDSQVTQTMLQEMFECAHDKNLSTISIIAPFHANPYHTSLASEEQCLSALVIMTSGNLLNLSAYKVIGPFLEEFFIDYVDNEYCLRSNKMGYHVIQASRAILNHNLGELKRHKFLWKRFYSTNHSPIRRYYAFRNRSKIIKIYKEYFPDYCKFEKSRFFVDAVIVLLYEKQKFKKFKMMLRGYLDYKRNVFGKYHD